VPAMAGFVNTLKLPAFVALAVSKYTKDKN